MEYLFSSSKNIIRRFSDTILNFFRMSKGLLRGGEIGFPYSAPRQVKGENMRFEIREEGNVTVVTFLEKRLDASIAMEFRQEMNKLIENGNTCIVLNLVNGRFMDSSFFFTIVSSLKLIGKDGNIVISGAGSAINNMLILTKMDRVFQMFKDERDAINALSA